MVIIHLIWMFLKLSKGKGRVEGNIVCNFVNMVRVNLVIHLVKNFYALLFGPPNLSNLGELKMRG